ncbi:helix-turn-helix domain-containing protein [Limibacter armeniacum]|uniref:helix-turn-helix domain-containing protein n=1 Tax=Limibacter armeniacum TaxID=466084 RepID=UPI002FE5914B
MKLIYFLTETPLSLLKLYFYDLTFFEWLYVVPDFILSVLLLTNEWHLQERLGAIAYSILLLGFIFTIHLLYLFWVRYKVLQNSLKKHRQQSEEQTEKIKGLYEATQRFRTPLTLMLTSLASLTKQSTKSSLLKREVECTLEVGGQLKGAFEQLVDLFEENTSQDIQAFPDENNTEDKLDPIPLVDFASTSYKLIIVEKNADLLRFLTHVLCDTFQVLAIQHWKSAEKALFDFEPNLILLGSMKKEESRFACYEELKGNVVTNHMAVVVLADSGRQQDQVEWYQQGADDYIIKPFDAEVLKAKLLAMLKNRERLLQNIQDGLLIESGKGDGKLDMNFLSRLLDVVNEHYSNTELSVEELAEDLCMSRSQLFRKLKSQTGQTPSEYLYAFRIKKAIELLKERKLSIADIAKETGFSSPNSFSKTFSKHIGVSPSRYLRNMDHHSA